MYINVKDCAALTAKLLQDDELAALIESYSDTDTAAASDSDVKTVLTAVSLAASEISGDGFPALVTEKITATNGILGFGTRKVEFVLSVEKDGRRVRYSVADGGLKVAEDGEYTVSYAVETNEAALGETIRLGEFCNTSMAAYLAARNVCLITGRTDEAAIWDQRYNAEAEKKRLRRLAHIAERRWR